MDLEGDPDERFRKNFDEYYDLKQGDESSSDSDSDSEKGSKKA
jgi:hypothetical protein